MPGTRRHALLQRLSRSLDQFGSLTPAMQAAIEQGTQCNITG
jgi:hypothetical protein